MTLPLLITSFAAIANSNRKSVLNFHNSSFRHPNRVCHHSSNCLNFHNDCVCRIYPNQRRRHISNYTAVVTTISYGVSYIALVSSAHLQYLTLDPSQIHSQLRSHRAQNTIASATLVTHFAATVRSQTTSILSDHCSSLHLQLAQTVTVKVCLASTLAASHRLLNLPITFRPKAETVDHNR